MLSVVLHPAGDGCVYVGFTQVLPTTTSVFHGVRTIEAFVRRFSSETFPCDLNLYLFIHVSAFWVLDKTLFSSFGPMIFGCDGKCQSDWPVVKL